MLVRQPLVNNGSGSGVRKDVLNALNSSGADPPRHTKKLSNSQGLVDETQPGELRIHSSSIPHLQGQQTYNLSLKQDISYSKDGSTTTLEDALITSRSIFVDESPWNLDASSIHSVYPPPGHSDYANVLPQAAFTRSILRPVTPIMQMSCRTLRSTIPLYLGPFDQTSMHRK